MWDGPVQVSDEGRLFQYSGWSLLETFEADDVRTTYNHLTSQNETTTARVRKYLMGQNPEDALSQALKSRGEADAKLDRALRELGTVKKSEEKAKEELEKLKLKQVALEGRSKQSLSAREKAEKRLGAFERDMSKIKSAIGGLRWKEILGPEPF